MLIKNLLLFICLGFFMGNTSLAQDYEYIGAVKCKMCHNSTTKGQQYKKWSEGPHANAMKKLSAADAKNPKCLKCHSTTGSTDKSLHATITVKEGVSCESCHGPGSVYKSISIMKSQEKSIAKGLIVPDEKLCKKCHNEQSPDFKGFDYKTYSEKIAHPKPAAE